MNRPTSPTTPTPADRSWLTFGLCAVAIFAITAAVMTGDAWVIFAYELLANGLLMLLWVSAAAGIGWGILRLMGIAPTNWALSFATSAAMGLGVMSLLILGLGLVGWLNLSTAVAMLTAGILLAALKIAIGWQKLQSTPLRIERATWLWLLVVPLIAIALVGTFILPGILWNDEPNAYDVLEYHLQVPREWYEMGRIAPLDHNVFSYFPFNVEMHYLLAMHIAGGPWNGMYLAQMMHFAFVALTVIAVYGVIRVGAKPQAAIAGGMLVAMCPWMGMLAPIAYVEGGMLLFGTLAAAWAIHGLDSPRRLRLMILAGALAGFACGAKLTAVPMVLGAVAAAIVLIGFIRRGSASQESEGPHPMGEGVRCAVVFVIAGIVTFSPWLIRNMAWAGNPVFPEAMTILGQGHFSDEQVERWDAAHSPAPDDRGLSGHARAVWKQLIADWRYGFALLSLAIAGMFLGRRKPVVQMLMIILGIQFIFWIGFTHLQGRFFVLAIPIAAILIGQIELPGWNIAVIILAAVGGCVGGSILPMRIERVLPLIGRMTYRDFFEQLILDPGRTALVFDQERPLVLVGDAQVFRYQIPMSRLSYRTVFDVNVAPGESVIDAWKGDAPPDALILVDPNELRRFHDTYAGIPAPRTDQNAPYLIDPLAPATSQAATPD